MPRSIGFENIENFRDLGGYACDYGETEFGVFFRSATLASATPSDIEKIHSLGIKTVIDLRDGSRKEAEPSPIRGDSRFHYVSLFVHGAGRIPRDFEDQIDSYIEMFDEPESAKAILNAFLHEEKPILFHCDAGKDRTGAFAFLLLSLAGVRFEDINADYMLSFPYLPKATEKAKALGKDIIPELLLTPRIDFLYAVKDAFMKRFGSFKAYIVDFLGMDQWDLRNLQNVMGKQEKSCGAVLFHNDKVLVEQMSLGHFAHPKGHVEASDASEWDTARREILEELGLHAKAVGDKRFFRDYSPRPGRYKRVVFFVAETDEEEIHVDGKEVTAAYWMSVEEALKALTHESDRSVLLLALEARP